MPLASALHHLRCLGGGGRPVIHAQRHQLSTSSDALPLQRKRHVPPHPPQVNPFALFYLPRSCRRLLTPPVKTRCGCRQCGSMSHATSSVCVMIFIFRYHQCTTFPLLSLHLLLSSPLCFSFSSFLHQSLEDLEVAKCKKKKEKIGLGSLSRVFARGKQRKSLDPGLFDGTATPDYYIEEDADW